ncbi:hypothetical protein BD413DRAFT_608519 [Trametes elegans]|nr:hypothetical protein BD413DRAFT_608519 [Trametes elegans]
MAEVFQLSAANSTAHLSEATQCSHCGQWEYYLRRKLKKCGGCAVAKYCSKECQKSAWPTHKEFCHRPDIPAYIDPFVGYSNALRLADAIKDWTNIHTYAFTVLTNATVLLNGGIAANVSPPHVFQIELALGVNNAGPAGNPAAAFKIHTLSIRPKDEIAHRTSGSMWADSLEACTAVAEEKRQADPMHVVAGVLPAVFSVVNTPLVTWHHFPVYVPYRRGATPLDDAARAVAEDVMELCYQAMNVGTIYRAPETRKREPDVGTITRWKKKKWQWKPHDDEDAYWDSLARGPNAHPTKSGHRPRDVWGWFHTL